MTDWIVPKFAIVVKIGKAPFTKVNTITLKKLLIDFGSKTIMIWPTTKIDKQLKLVIRDLKSISPTCLFTALMHKDPKSAKRQSIHQCLFTHLRSMQAKAAPKMLIKLPPFCRQDLSYPFFFFFSISKNFIFTFILNKIRQAFFSYHWHRVILW